MTKKLISWDDLTEQLAAVVEDALDEAYDPAGAASGAQTAAATDATAKVLTETNRATAAEAAAITTAGTDATAKVLTETNRATAAEAAAITTAGTDATAKVLTETNRATAAEAAAITTAGTDATTKVAAEAVLARSATNLASGTVADARLPSSAQAATLTATYAPKIGAWTAFTPTLGDLNLGSTGSATGRYQVIGKTIVGQIELGFGGTGISIGAAPRFYLPLARYDIPNHIIGRAAYYQSAVYNGLLGTTSLDTGVLFLRLTEAKGVITTTTPHTWAAGGAIWADFVCELN